MTNILRGCMFLMTLLASPLAVSGYVDGVKVQYVQVQSTSDSYVNITFTAGGYGYVGYPACAASGGVVYRQFFLDMTLPNAKEVLATILLARALDREVLLSGFNTCSAKDPIRETLAAVILK